MGQPRLMLAAGASGSGKTLITCGLLTALNRRGMKPVSFKCGPDYIDPMFHESVLGVKCRNLDAFFTDRQTTRYLFSENAKEAEVSVLEGVMGYYDGLGGISTTGSAYDLACVTETPVVLIVNARGMSLSVLPYIKGFLTYRQDSHICGVIFNQMSAMLYPRMKKIVEEELNIPVYGYVPRMEELSLESRHLGLVMPRELPDLKEKLLKLAEQLESSLDIDGLLKLAETAPEIEQDCPDRVSRAIASVKKEQKSSPVIAVARDEAFCFLYGDNLSLLRKMGAGFVMFSPLHDSELPKEADGLLIYGGYPELFARELSQNSSMKESIARRLSDGLPCMAECGGFMYLHREFENMEGEGFPGVSVIDGRAFRTRRLVHFGYAELTAKKKDGIGSEGLPLRAHEFHYFDSTANGEDFTAAKPFSERKWSCMYCDGQRLLGFPHLYYYANPETAASFVKACSDFRMRRKMGEKIQ